MRGPQARTTALAAAVTCNLLLLAVFKYAGFIIGNLDSMMRPLGLSVLIPQIALPLGISFFTFHCISYITDVYRRRFRSEPRPGGSGAIYRAVPTARGRADRPLQDGGAAVAVAATYTRPRLLPEREYL